jgi:hypothetical protein
MFTKSNDFIPVSASLNPRLRDDGVLERFVLELMNVSQQHCLSVIISGISEVAFRRFRIFGGFFFHSVVYLRS